MSFNRKDYIDLITRLQATGVYIRALECSYDSFNVINIRHDVDDNLDASVAMAELEEDLGIQSTYFILDTAPYWSDKKALRAAIKAIDNAGHYIGWHNNAISNHIRTGIPLSKCITEPLDYLEKLVIVTGTASHGDPLCYEHEFLNYNLFKGTTPNENFPYYRMDYDLDEFGLEYEAYHTGHTHYISESGGQWRQDNEKIIADFEACQNKQINSKLQVLVHPQHWVI